MQQTIREQLLNRKDQLLKAAYYDVARNETKVTNYLSKSIVDQANAGGKEPFPFAVGTDLYVPRIGGKRATRVEQWFNRQETALAKLIDQLRVRQEPLALTA